MDYAGLIEEIRHHFDDVPLVMQAADAIEELSKHRLISASEKLPKLPKEET